MITVWYPASIQLVLWKVSDLTSKAIKFQPIIWPLELSVIELQCAFKNRQPGDMKSICPQKKMMHWRRRQGRPYFRKFYLSGLPFISLMILASPFTFWVFQKYLLYENNHLCPKWVVVGIKKTKSSNLFPFLVSTILFISFFIFGKAFSALSFPMTCKHSIL